MSMLKLFGKYWAKKLMYQQRDLHEQQRQMLLSLGNGLKYFHTDLGIVKETVVYKRCAAIIDLISPMDIKGMKYVRLGKDYDGGYVMADFFDEIKVDAAYSFGIDNDVSWDEAMAQRNIDIFMYDHTIKRLPKENPRFHYSKQGLTGRNPGPDVKTLSRLIEDNQHTQLKNMVMKMDIEGCEWDVFDETPSKVLNQFSQFVVELHGLKPDQDLKKLEVLKKINETHQSVYVHANCINFPLWVGDLVLPEVMEVTYVRKSDFKDRLTVNTRQFPTEIDQPNSPLLPDIYLGTFASPFKKPS